VDAVKGHKSPLTGRPVYVVGAGGVYDGRSLAANLAWGAAGVWVCEQDSHSSLELSLTQVGTRFVACTEAAAPKMHKEELLSAGYEDAITTLIYTGRPLRVRRTEYIENWLVMNVAWSLPKLNTGTGTTTAKMRSRP
jgi:NAD(P)H-dependent flavin oxidoreductase YrpB (nitropropane dioxygenase family)